MSDNITKGEDGKYRWVYEFNMLTNPIILFTVLKIFVLVLLAMFVIFGAFAIPDKGFVTAFRDQALELAIPAALLFALSLLSYFILACIYGFRYCVMFEMDESGISHIQLEKQYKKAQVLGVITALSGLAAGNISTVGTGILAGARNRMDSEFPLVRKVKCLRAFHTIKLDAPMNHNQIYVADEDYEFVRDFILERTPKAKKK